MEMLKANIIITPLPTLRYLLSVSVLLLSFTLLKAEGTRQVAPSSSDYIMLETNRLGFGNFGAYDGPAESRLYVSIKDPSEMIYLGLSSEYDDDGDPLLSFLRSQYTFRIRRLDEANNNPVVHGPFTVNLINANVSSWEEALFGNYDLTEEQNGELMYVFDPQEAGDYFIEFEDIAGNGEVDLKVLLGYWDITVANNDIPQLGRVWSQNWAFRAPPLDDLEESECKWNREFNGELFSYTADGFVSKINFFDSGFQGLSFNVVFNSKGPGLNGPFSETRKSLPGVNATANSAEHKIFLNEPDILLFPDGECGDIFSEAIFNCQTDTTYCLDVSVTRPGLVEIFLDFNRNSQFDPGTADVSVTYDFTENELSACVPWDGITGLGTPASFGDTINIIFVYSQGVQNWAAYDVEFMKRGFCVERVRPTCDNAINTDILYWDDTNFLGTMDTIPGTGQPLDGRGGCPCRTDGCRTWTTFATNLPDGADCTGLIDSITTGYGDKNTLNTWWFANIIRVKTVNVPLLTCQIIGDASICQGDTTSFEVETSGTSQNVTYLWSGPGIDGLSTANTGPIFEEGDYCVTIVDEEGCTTICCETLTFVDSLTINVEIENGSCFSSPNGQITINASGGAGVFFYSIDGATFSPSNVFDNLLPGIYTVTVLDSEGCSKTLDVEVEADFPDDVIYPDTFYVCFGDSVRLAPNEILNYAYEWAPANGLSDPNLPDPLAAPLETTTYTVTITLGEGENLCQYSQDIVVVVYPEIKLSVSGGGNICTQETTLVANSDVANVSFAWLNENGDTLSTETSFMVTVMDSTRYVLTAEDEYGCIESLDVDVVFDPVVVNVTDTVSVCLGEEVIFSTDNLDLSDTLLYQWSPSSLFDGPTDVASPNYIEQIGVQTVSVIITNQHGCSVTQDVTVSVIDPNIDLSFTSEVQCDGVTVNFTNTSSNAFSYVWDFGDGTSSSDDNPVHIYTQGTYIVTLDILFEGSCVETFSREVIIDELQLVAAFGYEITDGACFVDSALVSFTDLSLNSFNNTDAWNWTFGTLGSSNEENPTFVFTQEGSFDVSLEIITANGCSSTITEVVMISLVESDSIYLQDTIIQCPGDSIILNEGGSESYIYNWFPSDGLSANDIASPVVMLDQTTTYTVQIQTVGSDTCVVELEVVVLVPDEIGLNAGEDVITCGENVVLNATFENDPASVEWSTLSGDIIASTASINVNPFTTETYIVSATNSFGCVETDTVVVIDNGVDLQAGGNLSSCNPIQDNIMVMNLDLNDILTYAWEPAANIISGANLPNPLISVTDGVVLFTVTATNQYGCEATASVTVSAGAIESDLADTINVCPGEILGLGPNANQNFSYNWAPSDNLNATDISNPIFSGSTSTTYFVTVTDLSVPFDCFSIDTVEVIVSPLVDLQLTGSGLDTTVCEIGTFTLSASAPANFEVVWYDNINLLPPSIGTGAFVDVDLAEGNNTFYALATDDFGCIDTANVLLSVTNFIPEVEGDTTIQVCSGLAIGINPDGNPAYEYVWDPIDGLDLTEPWNPVVETDIPLNYIVTITDPVSACSEFANITIEPITDANLELEAETVLYCEFAE
ncbi:MAG: PKD domain-containing protein, partial [Saprospiraceae bacterium]|nr:PKD domain-containing protein [Saprospiraceae bacterium]